MKSKTLTVVLFILGFGLGIILLSPERSISKLMESCGEFISNVAGL